jgi:hypothetical protein
MPETPLLGLPLIEAAQAQKHVTHNEALLRLDAEVQLAVIDRTLATPPTTPADGDRYLIAASPTGVWSGHAGDIAYREAGSWRFATPRAGWRLWVEAEAAFLVFDGSQWIDLQAIGELQNMSMLGVNTTADTANRLAVASSAALFTHVGAGTQIKVNKNAAADTASLLFQDGFSGRAEMGLAGDDNFHVKVSANGSAWTEAILVDRTSGIVTLTPNSIGNTALADMAAGTLKGAAVAGDPVDLSGTQATALLDVFGSSAKGLAPASGGGTTNFLRADGTWAAPPGGGGGGSGDVVGPASATDKAIVRFDAATGKLIQNSGAILDDNAVLQLPVAAIPSPPSGGNARLFIQDRAGREVQAWRGATGLEQINLAHPGVKAMRWAMAVPTGTTPSTQGIALTATGTATANSPAATNRYSRIGKLDYLVTTAATTAVAGVRMTPLLVTIGASSAGDGGFDFKLKWGPATGGATSTHRGFAGLTGSTTAPTDVEPSTLVNMVGMGWDAADANIQIMHNDGSGTATKIDLGSNFPVPSADRANYYLLELYSPPGTTQIVGYRITDLLDGDVAAGLITTNLPSNSTLLAGRAWMSVGGTSSVIGIGFSSMTIETDY